MVQVEKYEQIKLFQWADYEAKKLPALKYMFAIPNGLYAKNVVIAKNMKMQGLKKGVCDIMLPYPTQLYAGLFIELKRPKVKGQSKPVISKEQKMWIEYLNSVGYKAVVAYGANEAIQIICDYLA